MDPSEDPAAAKVAPTMDDATASPVVMELDPAAVWAEVRQARKLVGLIAVPTGEILGLLDLAWSREVAALSAEMGDLIKSKDVAASEKQEALERDTFVEAAEAVRATVVRNAELLASIRSTLHMLKPTLDSGKSVTGRQSLSQSVQSVEMLLLLHEEAGKLLSGVIAKAKEDPAVKEDPEAMDLASEEEDWADDIM